MAAKLPLIVRKNLRDNWESKKAEVEGDISSTLGVPWVTEIDAAAVYAHADSSYAKDNLGGCIFQ